MEKTIRPLIAFIAIFALAIVAIEITDYLMFNYSAPVSGSITITDEVGDTTSPEQQFTDILEVTVERNETNLTIVVKVGGDLPNQSEERIGYSFGYPTSSGYRFGDLVRLDLEDNQWIPKLGDIVVGSALHMDYWYVECAGKDFPGSFTIDHDTIRINLDSNLLRERDLLTGVRCGVFSWFVRSGTALPHKPWGKIIGSGITWDTTITSHFPDYESFVRQSEQSSIRQFINLLYLIVFIPFLIVGVVYWWMRAQKINF